MNDLVIVNQGQIVVSSRQVAEHFEKRHDHILRDIERIRADVPKSGEMFAESTLPDTYGRAQRTVLLNRDGFSLLVMGFTGSKAIQWKLKYIRAFNEMEQQLTQKIPQTFAEALQLAADQAKLLEAAKPAIEFVEKYTNSTGLFTLREAAKIIGIPERTFSEHLRHSKFIFGRKWQPSSRFVARGYFSVKTSEKNGVAFTQSFFTPSGIEWIAKVTQRKGWLNKTPTTI